MHGDRGVGVRNEELPRDVKLQLCIMLANDVYVQNGCFGYILGFFSEHFACDQDLLHKDQYLQRTL